MDIRVTRTFTVNGKAYESIDELPGDIRRLVEQAVGSHPAAAWARPTSAAPAKIVVNGTEYDGVAALPPEIRQLYEAAMNAVTTGAVSTDVTVQTVGPVRGTRTRGFAASFSPRFLLGALIVAALVGLGLVRLLGG